MAEPDEASPLTQQTPDENAARPRGRHKIYVGMASGVGKTYRALQDLHELLAAGRRVMIGVLETHGRRETQDVAYALPSFPRREVEFKGAVLSEMDLGGLLHLRPEVVLVDDLAHTNAPGSAHARRYEDVEDLLAAGIDVVSTVNIQHLESLNDLIARLTGVRVKDRLPDKVLQEADEVVLVDVSPQTLQHRLRAGKIYSPDKVDAALKNFFTESTLTTLRELALRQVADAVQGEDQDNGGVKERILVACALEPESGRLIRRGGRIASRLGGELDVVFVSSGKPDAQGEQLLQFFQDTTEALGGHFKVIPSQGNIGRTLVQYVEANHITQVVIGESSRSRWEEFLRGSIVHTVLRHTRNVDVYVLTRE
ncbi:universal stress protein [Deinococcus peraridilitoris]|uniref:Osmosensitive K+ channel His kinase sensor n=1 Tax=Deinococcus peraridilitoris (strain DSM 19664 / LMG 22246 / CIP 109416 / KR-200) TaxID=937777 RepID=L0A4X7_DEIPD|nr:universal stress protein [Deinococcus peraridilitoris]AFZ68916.1 osmosensitive K+ channel His kinase sensor [Deinococcus peraridilitoris DSM 19664]